MGDRTYLGDGAYAEFDGYQVWVFTSDGERRSAAVALEPGVFENLVRYAEQYYGPQGRNSRDAHNG